MKKQIVVYGAIDRFNYGDLLFAVVLDKIFGRYNGYEVTFYGLQESDLSEFGGKPTQSIQRLFEKNNLGPGSIIIVAGGEMLGAAWFLLHRYILPQSLGLPLRMIEKIIGVSALDQFSRICFKSSLDLPFVVAPNDFSTEIKVVYNAVGGSSLNYKSKKTQQKVLEKLKKAAWVSVRDKDSVSILKAIDDDFKPVLSPDSAVLMADLFPKSKLNEMISPYTQDIIRDFSNGYICFQCAEYLVRNNVDIIASELTKISKTHELGIVLLPIGRAAGHEDQDALASIKNQIGDRTVLPPENNIYDIMALIANAEIFAGTSLHGNITAMSFCVPYIGLSERVFKLDAYLKTWALAELDHCVNFEEMSVAVENALKIPLAILEKSRNAILETARINMTKMKQAIGLETELETSP